MSLLNTSKQNLDEIAWPDSSLPCTDSTSLASVVLQRHTGGVRQGERTTLSSADVLCHNLCFLSKM